MSKDQPSWLPSKEEMDAYLEKQRGQRGKYVRSEEGGPMTMMLDRGVVAADVDPLPVSEKSWLKRTWKRLLCSHTHYRLSHVEFDGVSVYQCRHCLKIKRVGL